MVVDDAIVVRRLLMRWIAAEPDMTVAACLRTGREAVEQIDECDPDVVVLDIDMPELDGLSALPILLETAGIWPERLAFIMDMMRKMSFHTDPQEIVQTHAHYRLLSEQVQAAYAAFDQELKIVADIQAFVAAHVLADGADHRVGCSLPAVRHAANNRVTTSDFEHPTHRDRSVDATFAI